MARSDYRRVWTKVRTLRTLKDGSREMVMYDVFINWDVMNKLAQKAADNKSTSSKMGPVLVNVTSRKKEGN